MNKNKNLMNENNYAAENNNINSLETAKKKRRVKLPTQFTAVLTRSISETRTMQYAKYE